MATDQLPEEQKKFLDLFSRLSPEKRQYIVTRMEYLLDLQEKGLSKAEGVVKTRLRNEFQDKVTKFPGYNYEFLVKAYKDEKGVRPEVVLQFDLLMCVVEIDENFHASYAEMQEFSRPYSYCLKSVAEQEPTSQKTMALIRFGIEGDKLNAESALVKSLIDFIKQLAEKPPVEHMVYFFNYPPENKHVKYWKDIMATVDGWTFNYDERHCVHSTKLNADFVIKEYEMSLTGHRRRHQAEQQHGDDHNAEPEC